MQYRDMRISVRMFLDDFINPPLRDYVVFYLEKVEKTLKLPVHHVFIYDEVETMKVKEFSDFIVEKTNTQNTNYSCRKSLDHETIYG